MQIQKALNGAALFTCAILLFIGITVFRTTKEIPACQYAFALGQVHAAMRATHHILGNRYILPGNILAIRPDQQINHYRDGKKQK
jgi:hypothetical protein